jgi:hypothetical protein
MRRKKFKWGYVYAILLAMLAAFKTQYVSYSDSSAKYEMEFYLLKGGIIFIIMLVVGLLVARWYYSLDK